MSSLNKVMLIGRAGQDPEQRYTAGGAGVTTLSLATSEAWKDKASGERKEATEWHRVVLFERLAEIAAEYVRKGSLVYVEGKLTTRKWQDKQGVDRYTTEIRADRLQLLTSRRQDGDGDDGAPREQAERRQEPAKRKPAPSVQRGGFDDEEIPFANPYRGRLSYVV